MSELPLPLLARGKVRDIYLVDEAFLLIVTTDRLSAFDVILPNAVPSRGKVLNQMSAFWFNQFQSLIPNHLVTTDIHQMNLSEQLLNDFGNQIDGRTMLVHRTRPLPVECVVRGYLSGSGWKDYQKNQTVCGHSLPLGLQWCQQLPTPLFTPATKATEGHDENIDFQTVEQLIGAALAEQLRTISLRLYQAGARLALDKGIIIADTKFEFGLFNNELMLIDEVLTPDSSRFWPKDQYEVGKDQPSFDKQIVRNFLLSTDWNQQAPAPTLPASIIEKTSAAYRDIFYRLTGQELSS